MVCKNLSRDERLMHICPTYILVTDSRGMVNGILLARHGTVDCAEYHFKNNGVRHIYRRLTGMKRKYMMSYLLIFLMPNVDTISTLSAVCIIMDGYSRSCKHASQTFRIEGKLDEHKRNLVNLEESQT